MPQEVMSLIILIAGLLLCFFGFKVQKILITVAWFLIGYNLVGYVNGLIHVISDGTILVIACIVFGILLAGVGYKLEKIALFIAVAYLAFTTIGAYIPVDDQRIAMLIQGAAALIIGALSTLFIKPILIGVSSIAGGTILKDYIPQFINIPTNILSILVLVVVISGVLFQIKTS